MSAPVIQGWCPGALRPMASGDGLVVRVRPRGGRLEPAQAAGIAALSRAHGNGVIDLSARANVQLRGVTEASHGPLLEGLRALGLLDESIAAETRRNIVVTPFWDAGDGTQALAQALAKALAPDAPALPGKFGFAVDTGATPVLRGTAADIRLECSAEGRLLVRADGASTGANVTPETAAETALHLARWFVESGGISESRGRMAAHLARGAVLPGVFREAEALPPGELPQFAPGTVPQGQLVGFAFGQMQAETLAALAGLWPLRVTPWRMLLIEGLRGTPALPGLITDAHDPLLRVIACTGAPGCPQALQPTRPLARALAAHVPSGQMLHVSGCAKACAHPGQGPVTLLAEAGGFRHGATGPALSAKALLERPQTLFEAP
ncbi:precorrin-3B synthase [Rhodobacter ferrooxidans]|uniref:Precorrin-3B synthase n=1 Tax=Rhodobacter ferrooxidans TaxID=371731 RepID=C8S2S0_9RHOB|nr:precorrin-3B synthase [Rhodobacter sp. SW2]EEW24746.1 precorrin-3B synthase [Rhodobacter sp. SW2]